MAIAFCIALVILLIRKRRSKAINERESATVKSPTTDKFGSVSQEVTSPISELASPAPSRPAPLYWNQEPPTPGSPLNPIGGIELPAEKDPIRFPPQEMMGSTYIDEHHPAYNSPPQSPPLSPPIQEKNEDEVHPADGGRRDTIATLESDGETPIYSPIGGSALLPDSPHLNGGFVSERIEELERGKSPIGSREGDNNRFSWRS